MTTFFGSERSTGTAPPGRRSSARSNSRIGYFDRMRTKRNQAIYDVAGLITEKEARSILKNAARFVETVKAQLDGQTDS